jgi:cyclopropane-fatty-acyl-phospholipid synthase
VGDRAALRDALAAGGLPRPARALFAILSRLRHGRLEIVAPGGQSFTFPGAVPGPDALLALEDWDVCAAILRRGDIGLAETFLAGRWTTPDLPALLSVAALNDGVLERANRSRLWSAVLRRLHRLCGVRARAASRRNVHARHDLGNDFYLRWLDATMTYSSAWFAGDFSRSLEDAQLQKYERILRLLDPRPGSRVLDVGCGWGGFAEYAARTRGCNVHGVTVSRRQLEFARARIRDAGLSERVAFELRDYREVQGNYDHVVSIEMYETLGERHWPAYFRILRERLKPGGRAVVQAITIADERFARYRSSTDFIRQFILPVALLASPSRFRALAEGAGLTVHSSHAFGMDYAETLRRWNRRFTQAWPQMRAQGLDERFLRLWSFYLSHCEAGFRSRSTDVLQVEMGLA